MMIRLKSFEQFEATARMRMVATKSNAPNVAQQLTSRYERLQREKEEIMKRLHSFQKTFMHIRYKARGGGNGTSVVGSGEGGQQRTVGPRRSTRKVFSRDWSKCMENTRECK